MRKTAKTLTAQNRAGLALSVAISVFFSLPNLLGFLIKHEGKLFLGQVSWFDPWDINIYVSAISWAQVHGFNFQNAYTTQSSNSVILYPLYTLLGTFFKNINPFVIFQTATFVCGVVLAFTIYYCANVFLKNQKASLVATVLVSLGGGFGWLLSQLVVVPDIHISPFTFAGTYQKAHEALAVSGMLFSIANFYKFVKSEDPKFLRFSIAGCLLLCLFYPYYIVSLSVLFFSYSVFYNQKAVKGFLTFLLITWTLVGAYSIYLKGGESFGAVFSPNFETIKPLQLILGYGILVPAFIALAFKRKKTNGEIYLIIWFLLNILISFLPIGIGKYYLRGLYYPLVVAAVGLALEKKIIRLSKSLSATLAASVILTSVLIFNIRIFTALGFTQSEWAHTDSGVEGVIAFLNQRQTAGIITQYPLSNFIPAATPHKVYAGHRYQTPDFESKMVRQESFLKSELSDNDAKRFLTQNNIKLILTKNKEFPDYDFLVTIYENEGYRISEAN